MMLMEQFNQFIKYYLNGLQLYSCILYIIVYVANKIIDILNQ